MKTNKHQTNKRSAFTLIEMIGVLAVIAILAALLIPKIFEAINNARINTAVVGYNTIKTAVMDHYGKYGNFTLGGTNATVPTTTTGINGYDTNVLAAEALIDKPFAPRVGTNAYVVWSTCSAANTAVTGSVNAYDLDGNSSAANDAAGTYILECVIEGVALADAQAISRRLDGPSLSEVENAATADLRGRVIYAVNGNNPVAVRMYITHR